MCRLMLLGFRRAYSRGRYASEDLELLDMDLAAAPDGSVVVEEEHGQPRSPDLGYILQPVRPHILVKDMVNYPFQGTVLASCTLDLSELPGKQLRYSSILFPHVLICGRTSYCGVRGSPRVTTCG